jgi:hypothetical protein
MHVDPTPQDAPRPDVDAPTLHAAYAPPIGYTLLGVDYGTRPHITTYTVAPGALENVQIGCLSPAPSPTTDEGDE